MAQAMAEVNCVDVADAEPKHPKVNVAGTETAGIKREVVEADETKNGELAGEEIKNVQVKGCHLVGSSLFESTEAFMRACCAAMPDRLKRLPDGETGDRHMFTLSQYKLFLAAPECMVTYVKNAPPVQHNFSQAQVEEGMTKLKKTEMKTCYDDAAIASYSVFTQLRNEGVVPKGCKFQVSLPSYANVLIPFVQRDFQAQVAPIYEAALFRALHRIQDEIPHEDLCIQLDLAVDTAFWEGTGSEGMIFKPWFDKDVKANVLGYVTRMAGNVYGDVELGIHYCFGKSH